MAQITKTTRCLNNIVHKMIIIIVIHISSAMQANYSAASSLAYGTRAPAHTRWHLQLVLHSVSRYKMGRHRQRHSHTTMAMIVRARFKRKEEEENEIWKQHFQGCTKRMGARGGRGEGPYVWNNLNICDIHSFGCFFLFFFMYSLYLYLYRSSAYFFLNRNTQEINNDDKEAAFCECCAKKRLFFLWTFYINPLTVSLDQPPPTPPVPPPTSSSLNSSHNQFHSAYRPERKWTKKKI